eukprot:gene15288-32384_t
MLLKICVLQLNYCVGDLAGNAQKIIDAASAAYAKGARLVVTPELAICGYAAEDLFLRASFIQACDDAVNQVAHALAGLKGLTLVVGTPVAVGDGLRTKSVTLQHRQNAARVLREGLVIGTYAKRELPNYQVFDERRYFTPGNGVCVFTAGEGADAVKVGLLICEDAWFEEPARLAQEAGAELLAVINASPFHVGKGYEREAKMAERCQATGLPLVYAHLVGGQDEVVFEGHSFALNADGTVAGRAPSFKENLFPAQVERAQAAIKIIAVIAGIVLGGRLLIRPLLRWIARSKTPEIFTAAALLLVVGISALMLLVGLSMALGAFLAGVLLAESEYRRELETDIEPFKGLLLGLFFIAVGMGMDLGLLLSMPVQVVAGLLLVVGLKTLAVWALAPWLGLKGRDKLLLALLLSQVGEFAFVVLSAAKIMLLRAEKAKGLDKPHGIQSTTLQKAP